MIVPPRSRNDPCPCGSGLRYKHCHAAAEGPLRAAAPADAEAAWRQALVLDPGNAEARFHLGNACRERGDAGAAIVEYELALATAPGHAGILNNLGLALEAAGDRQRAEACYRQVLAVEPGQPDALGNLASALFERDDFAGAVAQYTRLFAIRPGVPAAVRTRCAIACEKTRRLDAAEENFREAARLAPDDLRVHFNLATFYERGSKYAKVEAPLLRVLELQPRHLGALASLAHARLWLWAWDGIEEMFEEIRRRVEGEGEGEAETAVIPFQLLAMPVSPLAQLRAARRHAAALAPSGPAARPDVRRNPRERLRVGFVSSDLRNHPMVALSLEFWERIDRQRIEAFAYGIEPEDKGPVGRRATAAFEHFVDVSAETNAALAQRIRDDRIAVLIDLNGFTKYAREGLFPLRPAPVQINFMGYPGTLGADWYDWILVDRFGAPDRMQWAYAEKLLHGPVCSFPSDTRRAPRAPPPSRAECGLPESGFVFCCFNNTYKVLPDVFAIWMRLMRAVPGSCLWLLDAEEEAKRNLRREMERAGVAGERVVFARRVPVDAHLARIAVADLFLDTFPYGAHTTANDALLVGLPVVTCAGETLASRIAGSQLHAIGLPELVTSSFAEYESLALRLARHPAELAEVRRRLAANRATHPLFDMARYTREFEDALVRAWEAYEGTTASG